MFADRPLPLYLEGTPFKFRQEMGLVMALGRSLGEQFKQREAAYDQDYEEYMVARGGYTLVRCVSQMLGKTLGVSEFLIIPIVMTVPYGVPLFNEDGTEPDAELLEKVRRELRH